MEVCSWTRKGDVRDLQVILFLSLQVTLRKILFKLPVNLCVNPPFFKLLPMFNLLIKLIHFLLSMTSLL